MDWLETVGYDDKGKYLVFDTDHLSSYGIAYKTSAAEKPKTIKTESVSHHQVKVSWSSVEGAVGYQIYRANSSKGNYKLVKVTKNTLSENGGVTRGICKVNCEGELSDVIETSNIVKTVEGAVADGVHIDGNSYVSMNMWGLTPEFIELLEKGFAEFFDGITENDLKAEYLLPVYIDQLLKNRKVSVKVLETYDKWFGVTYKEDKVFVVGAFKKLIEQEKYKENLFGDLNNLVLD